MIFGAAEFKHTHTWVEGEGWRGRESGHLNGRDGGVRSNSGRFRKGDNSCGVNLLVNGLKCDGKKCVHVKNGMHTFRTNK